LLHGFQQSFLQYFQAHLTVQIRHAPPAAAVFHEIAQILPGFSPESGRTPHPRNRNPAAAVWTFVMKTENGTFGILIGGIVALAAAIFIFSGGELGGKKTVEGDQDLPPIASADQN
jgi:hypothetical protein